MDHQIDRACPCGCDSDQRVTSKASREKYIEYPSQESASAEPPQT